MIDFVSSPRVLQPIRVIRERPLAVLAFVRSFARVDVIVLLKPSLIYPATKRRKLTFSLVLLKNPLLQ